MKPRKVRKILENIIDFIYLIVIFCFSAATTYGYVNKDLFLLLYMGICLIAGILLAIGLQIYRLSTYFKEEKKDETTR